MVRILYFARIREAVGTEAEEVALPESVHDAAGLVAWLKGRGGAWAQQLDRPYRLAVNQDLAEPVTPIRDGDEVAVFPPVTGG
jgi:sulfur-carrier protein